MGRHATGVMLLDGCKTLDINTLKKWGYLNERSKREGILRWNKNGMDLGSISIFVDTINYYCQLSYTLTDYKQSYNYSIGLSTKPSNLGKGQLWYFVCPNTNLLTTKLYLIRGLFQNLKAANGSYFYETQIQSKNNRGLIKYLDAYYKYEQVYQKHFRTHYKGKMTKRYRKLAALEQRGLTRYSVEDLLLM